MSKHSVLILGAHGHTGSSIVAGLLEDGDYHVVAAVRPTSASKPAVEALKAQGVEIRLLDLDEAAPEELDTAVRDVDMVISTVSYTQHENQRRVVDACKRVGVKRFIPSDWATACTKGVMQLHDTKLAIHDYIKEVGINYTFIDVGWWFQLALPVLDPAKAAFSGEDFINATRRIYGTGEVVYAVTDLRDVGRFVARILKDDRTLNKYVFCWGEEVTQNEVFSLADRVSGQKIPINQLSGEVLAKLAQEAEGQMKLRLEYPLSVFVRGDNVVANAKKEEYGAALDARELYPDLKVRTLENWAKEYY